MNKLVTLASVGVFLLSLQGASLAQDKTPATPASSGSSAGCGAFRHCPGGNAGNP